MRKALASALVGAMLFGLAGCSSGTHDNAVAPAGQDVASSTQPPAAPKWVEFGPAPMHMAFGFQGDMVGRITAIQSIDPTTIVVGTGGGIWRTTTATSARATSWTLTTPQRPVSIGALAQDPSQRSVLYAGTGEANRYGVASIGEGLYRSTDAGQSWTFMPGSRVFDLMAVIRIIVDPSDSQHLLVAVRNSLYASPTSPGLWSSSDGGATFSLLNGQGQPSDVVVDTANPRTVILSLIGRILRSADGGATWSEVSGFPAVGRVGLAASPIHPNRMYALAGGPDIAIWVGLFGSDDSGRTWVQMATSVDFNKKLVGQSSGNLAIAVDSTDDTVVYVGGITLQRVSGLDFTNPAAGTVTALSGGGVDEGDGGVEKAIAQALSDDLAGSPHVDHRALALDRAGNLLDGNDGGLWRLANPARTLAFPATSYTNLNGAESGHAMATIQFYGIALHPTRPDFLYGGTQDNGSPRFGGTLTWLERILEPGGEAILGDGGQPLIEATRPSYVWVQTQLGGLHRSVDSGSTFDTLEDSTNGIDLTESSTLSAPLVQVERDGQLTLATARTNVYETRRDDATGVVWQNVSNFPPRGTDVVTSLAYAPGRPEVLYAGTSGGHLYARTVEGGAFTDRSDGLPAGRFVSAIAVDAANPRRVCCTIGEKFIYPKLTPPLLPITGTVFRSDDGGETWRDVTSNLDRRGAFAVVFLDSTHLLVGTIDGVYISADDGRSWSRYGADLPRVPVFDLALARYAPVVVAGTFGRGLWEISTRADFVVAPPPTAALSR